MFNKVWKFSAIILFTLLAAGCGDSDNADNADSDLEIRTRLDLADVYRQQGQFRASMIEAQNALQLDTNSVETREFVSQVFRDLGDYNSSIEILNVALELEPENIDVNIALSESYLQSRQYAEGFELISNLEVATEEQQIRKDWLIGNFESAMGNTEAAEATFQAVLARDPQDLDTLLSYARLKYATGDINRATELTNQAIEANPSRENVDLWIWRGQFASLQEDWPTAEEAYFEALDIMALYDTMTAKRFSTLQSILVPLRNQQKNDEALRYSQIIANSPQGQLLASFSNALSLFETGELQQAEEALISTLELAPDHPGGNILLGLSKYQQGDFQEAERLLSTFVDVDSASAEIVSTLVDTYLKLNNYEGALAVLEEASQNSPENSSFLAMTGIVKQALGDQEGAIASLENALRIEPDSPQLLYTLGTIHAQMGEMNQALQSMTAAVQSDPNFTAAKSALLGIYTSQGNTIAANELVSEWLGQAPDDVFNNMAAGTLAAQNEDLVTARASYEKVLEIDSENIAAMLNLARVDLIENNFSAAENYYNEVLAVQATNTTALSGMLALGDLSETKDEKIARIMQVIEENPEEVIPSVVLGQYYLVSSDLENAAQYAESAYSIQENDLTRNFLVETTLQRAIRASENGDDVTALEYVSEALEIDNNSFQALVFATNLEAKAGNFVRARSFINQLKELQPDQSSVLELEGDVIISTNDTSGALVSYLNAWELEPSTQLGLKIYQVYGVLEDDSALENFLNEWSRLLPEESTPVLLLAMELQSLNREAEALENYERLYETQPENLVVLNNMAWLYKDIDLEKAFELASSAAQLYPENPDVLDTYGWILFLQNKREQALETLLRASELAPDSQEIQDHLDEVRRN